MRLLLWTQEASRELSKSLISPQTFSSWKHSSHSVQSPQSVIMFAKRSHLQSFHCLGFNEDGNCLDRKAPALIDMSFQPILSYPHIHPHTLIYHAYPDILMFSRVLTE